MRKQLAKFAAFGLALSLALGCLEDKGGGGSGLTGTSGTFVDNRDGKSYKWVKIGGQFWMAENLKYQFPGSKCYGEGGKVEGGKTISAIQIQANCVKYGRLYDWKTAMALPLKCSGWEHSQDDKDCAIKTPHHQGLCPAGWHIPSYEEWEVLFNYAGINFGDRTKTKLMAKSGWKDYDPCEIEQFYGDNPDPKPNPKCKKAMRSGNGTDDYGFSALPGGYGAYDSFSGVGIYGFWWRTEGGYIYTYYVDDGYDSDHAPTYLLGVRCLKD